MPLQNRVAPDGSLHAVSAFGTMLGNRGGKFHKDDRTLGTRRWASEHWICCELHFKDMHHEPMGWGYTSLFFLDEVTALAAGHRPCFYCRREEAKAFLGGERAGDFDRRVHAERVSALTQPTRFTTQSVAGAGRHPDGTMFAHGTMFLALRHGKFLNWSFAGYTQVVDINPAMNLRLLTSPAILAILRHGYQPRWHASALLWDD
jgi:hypothetical protein